MEAQTTVPKESGYVYARNATSYTKLLGLVELVGFAPGIRVPSSSKLNVKDKSSLKLLPEAFRLNTTLLHLFFCQWEVRHSLVSEAFTAAFSVYNLKFLKFSHCKNRSKRRLLKFMCQGLQERATAFQLELSNCSSKFVEPIIEASYLKCFSLKVDEMDCTRLEIPLKNLFKRNLCYITLSSVKGLKESLFLDLGRCVAELPNLAKLDLKLTAVPTSALERLHESLKMILDSGRSNLFEFLRLGSTEVGEKLCYAFFRLLSSDEIETLVLNAKGDLSVAVVKSISSAVANTRNLECLKYR